MHWLPESIKELVWEVRKDTENDFLRPLNEGSMSFKQYVVKVKKLMNNCDIKNAEAKESMIQNFIVTGINMCWSSTWCKTGQNPRYLQKQSSSAGSLQFQALEARVHQVTTDLNFPKEGGEEDIHKLHNKRRYSQNTRASSPENRYKHNSGRACHWCRNSYKPAYGKTVFKLQHHDSKRSSPRSSPNKPCHPSV